MISTYEIGTLLPQIECANVRRFFELTMSELKNINKNSKNLKLLPLWINTSLKIKNIGHGEGKVLGNQQYLRIWSHIMK